MTEGIKRKYEKLSRRADWLALFFYLVIYFSGWYWFLKDDLNPPDRVEVKCADYD